MMRQPRIIISVEGTEGAGKTRFALSAPRPMTYLDFDFGVEGVDAVAPEVHHQYDLLSAQWMADAAAKRHTQGVMQKFVADFRAAIDGHVRTLVVDTFTAAWGGQRLARSDDKYIEMEAEFKSLVQAAYASPRTNLILIHHLRQDWARDSSGKSYKAKTWSRDGMDGIANMVQLAVRQRFVQPVPAQMAGALVVKAAEPGRFEIDVMKSRDNVGMVGQTLPGVDFATLCSMVAPTVDWSK